MKKFTTHILPISLFVMLCFSLHSYAQQPQILETQSYTGHLVRITPKLADIDRTTMYGKPLVITRDKDGVIGIGRRMRKRRRKKLRPNSKALIQTRYTRHSKIKYYFSSVPGTSIGTSFDGQTSPGLSPTDNNMAAGPNHIIQIVNNASGSQFTVYNKSGVVVQGPTVLASLTGFPGFGDPCCFI